MRIGVTGLSSGVGQAVLNQAVLEGHIVEGMGRRPEYRAFDTRCDVKPSCIDGLDGVIHLAWGREPQSSRNVGVDNNVRASAALSAACARAGIPLVMISSSSAGQPHKSRYGAAKLASEKELSRYGFPSLRAGLIWGGGLSPILQTLRRLATLPVIHPLPSPAMVLDHNHELHVARLLLRHLTIGGSDSRVYSSASPEFVDSTEISQALRGSRSAIQAPIPSNLIAGIARRLRDSRIPTPPRLDSLALLDTAGQHLSFDPAYPEELGKQVFLSWLSSGNWMAPT